VVELRILEDGRDVTFGYNANFFLFATLDASRTTAQPRGQPVTQPVLTGVPVAGMAYLDRPRQAGYFIFPDLSVRHEGHYRLTFNLFEETKEGKDDDVPGSVSYGNEQPLMPSLGGPQNCMHFRMIVRSIPFQVYSAKKFPGLSESTPLSRMVADQGCRVRIRRDVRMRRRGANGKEEYGDFAEDENAYARDRIATPDNYGPMPHAERPRSASRGSIDPSHGHGYPHDLSRRTSMTDLGHYHAGYHTPQTPAPPSIPGFTAASQTQSHLSFGPQSAHQYQTPHLPPSLPPVTASALPPNAHLYHPMHARQHSSSNGFPFSSPLQTASTLQTRPDTPLITPQHEYKPDFKPEYKSEFQYPFPEMSNGYGHTDNGPGYKPSTPHLAPPHLANTSQSTLSSRRSMELPPIAVLQDQVDKRNLENRPPYDMTIFPSGDVAGPPPAAIDSLIQARKRTFESVFPGHNHNRPLHSGMRPESPSHGHESPKVKGHHGHEYYDRYDDNGVMTYRRADGVLTNKSFPVGSPHISTSQSDVADPW
jgi:hypothetical protein